MSNQFELVVEERSVLGKQVKRLRRDGIVPANLYGHREPSLPLQVPSAVLSRLFSQGGATTLVQLKIGAKPPVQALVKEVQHDPTTGSVKHVDFFRVAATEKFRTHVPLHFINEAEAMKLGDVAVQRSLADVLVECLPADLPAAITVDLAKLGEIGAVIRVGELDVPEGVSVLLDHEEVVAGVHRVAREAEPEVEAAAPAEGAPAPTEEGEGA
ncbi:MAG TPA: 50S ribosomal protein L25 [Chloroflexota bacterium]|nr:50S ribosomal protein L25 [Chloroflexota bacterium]